jgi:hypothetical protein
MSQFSPPPPPPPAPPFQPIPPTEPGLLGIPARATKWPVVIGVIAIVLGTFAAICSVCATAMPLAQDSIEAALPAGAMKEGKIEERWIPWALANAGISLLVAILQIVGGIGLMKRAPWSPKTLRTWAVLAIIAGVASTALNFQMETGKNRTIFVSATTSGPATTMPATLPAQAEKAILGVWMCMGLGYVCAFPVFVLIWLGRETVREEIRTWATAA